MVPVWRVVAQVPFQFLPCIKIKNQPGSASVRDWTGIAGVSLNLSL
jgi:hypothetical protein